MKRGDRRPSYMAKCAMEFGSGVEIQSYCAVFVLSGQRKRTMAWHTKLTKVLQEQGREHYATNVIVNPFPCLLPENNLEIGAGTQPGSPQRKSPQTTGRRE